MNLIPLIFLTFFCTSSHSQKEPVHSSNEASIIRSIYTKALTEGNAYEDLRFLCKEIGARITGSTEAQMAIEWSNKKMQSYGLETSLHEI